MLVFKTLLSKKDAMTPTRWGEEKTLYFILLYRQSECLWNTRSPYYKNKYARENAYQSIIKAFDDPTLDIKNVKTKIKNLRSIYHTELKKVKSAARPGVGELLYKPTLPWFDEIHSFLGDSIEDRTDTGDRDAGNNEVEQVSTENSMQTEVNVKLEPIQFEATETTVYGSNKSHVVSTSPLKTIRHPRTLNSKKRPYESMCTAIQKLTNTVSNAVNTKQMRQNPVEDEFYYFALSVAAQLRQLPVKNAITVQSKIQNLLSEERLGTIYSNTNNIVKTEDVSE